MKPLDCKPGLLRFLARGDLECPAVLNARFTTDTVKGSNRLTKILTQRDGLRVTTWEVPPTSEADIKEATIAGAAAIEVAYHPHWVVSVSFLDQRLDGDSIEEKLKFLQSLSDDPDWKFSGVGLEDAG